MPKNNEPDEMSKDLLKWLEEEDPFGLNEDINTILFKCKDCRKEDDVPDFVVADFQVDKKKGEEVEIECPFCGGTMLRAKESPK
jgi:hypothetical protein